MESDPQNNVNSMMREFSDIKALLAVNTSETSNIKASISEMKVDMKEIKNDFVNRRELNEIVTAIYEQISPVKKSIYGMGLLIVTTVIGAVLRLVIQ